MTATIDYYNVNAKEFIRGTFDVDFSAIQNEFLSHIPDGGYILDFGCGSGRDTLAFLEQGYRVDALDGSQKLCELVGKATGIEVRHMMFDELDDFDKYDGIWACASLLHVEKSKLSAIFWKITNALKVNGTVYASFKYGDFEGERNGRYFTDMTESSFYELIRDIPKLQIKKEWITGDVRAGRMSEKWLNVILKKYN